MKRVVTGAPSESTTLAVTSDASRRRYLISVDSVRPSPLGVMSAGRASAVSAAWLEVPVTAPVAGRTEGPASDGVHVAPGRNRPRVPGPVHARAAPGAGRDDVSVRLGDDHRPRKRLGERGREMHDPAGLRRSRPGSRASAARSRRRLEQAQAARRRAGFRDRSCSPCRDDRRPCAA